MKHGHPKKKRTTLPWIGAIAAVLALAIIAGMLLRRPAPAEPLPESTVPTQAQADTDRFLVAAPQYPILAAYPTDYTSENRNADYRAWWDCQRALWDQPDGYADSLDSYFSALLPKLLENDRGSNKAYSPLNIYMALAMLAEITDGESRQQILDLFRADSIEALRTQAGHVWKAHYNNDGLSKSVLGSSLWLNEDLACNEATAQLLAESYYASIFQGDLGSGEANRALSDWINEQTDGLLQEQAGDLALTPDTALALVTTICYQAQWQTEFSDAQNTQASFHGAAGDTEATFMNTTTRYSYYYWGDHFGAVTLPLKDNSRIWLLLPDEGYAPEDILDEAMAFLSSRPEWAYEYDNRKNIQINLSLPKFDVSTQTDLVDTLKALGITHVFDGTEADFTPIFPDQAGSFVDKITHAARLSIDEEGVTAAAFTSIALYGGAGEPKDEIDFTLDRPFIFYVESRDGLPLFTGIVNEV